jgi:hypothetical protein
MGFPEQPADPYDDAPAPGERDRPSDERCVHHSIRRTEVWCVECGVAICEDCASTIAEGDRMGHVVCPTCAPTAAVDPSIPWESHNYRGFDAFKRTFLMAFMKPSELFRAFPAAPLGRAFGFAMLAAIPGAILGSLSMLAQNAVGLGALGGFQDNPQFMRDMPPEAVQFLEEWGTLIEAGTAGLPILGLLFVPLTLLFSGLVYHLGAKMMGARNDLVTTIRIVCYLQPISVLAAIPMFGGIIAFVFAAIGMLTAMQRVGGLSSGKAAVVAFFPLILGAVLACVGCVGIVGLVIAANS